MEQRIYHGDISPESLADFLVGHYDPQENLQAQKIGQGSANAVQIGRGDVPQDLRHAVTVAITRTSGEEAPGVVVTMGQQQWLTPKMATYAAVFGLLGVLVTPWALFALLWPLSDAVGSSTLPGDIWNTIDNHIISQGGTLGRAQELTHPHAG